MVCLGFRRFAVLTVHFGIFFTEQSVTKIIVTYQKVGLYIFKQISYHSSGSLSLSIGVKLFIKKVIITNIQSLQWV